MKPTQKNAEIQSVIKTGCFLYRIFTDMYRDDKTDRFGINPPKHILDATPLSQYVYNSLDTSSYDLISIIVVQLFLMFVQTIQ